MKRLYILILTVLISLSSCKKFLEVDTPGSKIDMTTAFASDAAAISLATGIYVRASNSSAPGFSALAINTGLSADELKSYNFSGDLEVYYKNALVSSTYSNYWAEFYGYIYTANQIIEGVNGPNGLSPVVKTRLEGEAKFIRAYFYFYLVNLFGDVPLITSTNYNLNTTVGRKAKAEVYALLISDLKEAQTLLGDSYTKADLKTTSTERVRPNKSAATALLARVYLFTGDYAHAITESSKVIVNSAMYTLESLDNTFLVSSKETIFSFQNVESTMNTYEGNMFVLIQSPTYSNPVSLSSFVYNAFEPGDLRKTKWVGTYTDSETSTTYPFAYKYKVRASGGTFIPLTENQVLLRLAEQYLIRAEAYVQTNQTPLGIADLNTVRRRSRAEVTPTVSNPLPDLSSSLSKTAALAAIEHERQVEMFTELGDRWFTLKRMRGLTNPAISRADEVMPVVALQKNSTWNTNWQLYPVPLAEIKKDNHLLQNPGY